MVSSSTALVPALSSYVAVPSVATATFFAAELGLRGVAADAQATAQYSTDGVLFQVGPAWSSIPAVRVTDADGGRVEVEGARTVDIIMGGARDSLVEVLDSKRGRITTADGDDAIFVRGFFNDTDTRVGHNNFNIQTGAGDDTITVVGWNGVTTATIDAGDGNDRITGTSHRDTITGGAGDDRIWGGGGRDAFEFSRGHGRDLIEDFNAANNDRLAFDTTVAQADISWAAVDGGVLVTYGATDSVLLVGVRLADLALNDFMFG
jgi:Ca2+-binding RTX toxin-like protein